MINQLINTKQDMTLLSDFNSISLYLNGLRYIDLLVIHYMFAYAVTYPLTKYTTFGNHNWFAKSIDWLTSKISKESIKDAIFKLSYFKGLSCRPCHTFWLSFGIGMFLFDAHLFLSFTNALIMHFIAENAYKHE